MKNLENYGVQELNATEIRNTDGGLVFLTGVAIFLCVLLIAAPIIGWQSGRKALGQP